MNNLNADRELIDNFGHQLGGVFLLNDLKILFNEKNPAQVFRRIDALIKNKIITRFIRGVYINRQPDLEILTKKLEHDSYISCTKILSDNLVIGVSPQSFIDCIKKGKTRIYSDDKITVRQFGVTDSVYFGFKTEGGIARATKEKAVLDTLYLLQHGVKFPFDVYSDMKVSGLDLKLIRMYLKSFSNPKFVAFAEGIINENS